MADRPLLHDRIGIDGPRFSPMLKQEEVGAATVLLPVDEAIGCLRDYAASLGVCLSGPIARSPWSVVFRGSGGGYPGDIAVKMCLDPPNGCVSAPAALAAYEFCSGLFS